ncbi:MAG: TetR family transcriptional regulator [Burkholderiales bacterium GWA2_64_37]|uniref:TetR/AcrR family transcriptional regulator n=1 Tax=unclassified Acidovorax TaxID=2684926 RepID=UPI0008B898BA|nr:MULTISPECIES: TetR/AcrR family transcriptional regulator [unclassified Acidovorax]OGA87774.1 MAG: TetR family transcriptional regulator [Burkholderiales bacterium GWA2_64_37]QLA82303.1 TetR/AcrR family transcriptional regulator [Acidovorax sp. JMULE5]HCE92980.1 TetR family transcriptional regulator [Acidovorax sp.]
MSATPTKTRTASPRAASARKTGVREQAAQTTRDNILKAATKVFARYGYEGGSVEKISKAAKSFDRMIYYYFGSKEGLFIEVLEETYRRMNDAESKLDLDTAKPVEALQAVIRFVVGYYRKNPEFITLLNTENLHKGKHISKSMRAREYSSPAIEVIRRVLESGQAQGLFRKDVSARDVYLLIAATGYFYMSNRHTLSAFLGEDLETAEALAHWESFVIDSVLRTVAPGPSLPKGRVAAA